MAIANLRFALVAAACGTLCGAASAQAVDACHQKPLVTPWARFAQFKAQRSESFKTRRACDGATATPQVMDTTPPLLTAFEAVKTYDTTDPSSAISATFKSTDDLSGVRYVIAGAHGPSGQLILLSYREAWPQSKIGGHLLTGALPPFLEPGVYAVDTLFITDDANNTNFYDAAALSALGNVSFTVKNKWGFDLTPPALTRGRILTPKVSRSGTQPGTGAPGYVAVEVESTDMGNTATAGFWGAYMEFCLLDHSSCLYLENTDFDGARPGTAKATIRLSAQPSEGQPIGDYHIASYYGYDHSGNAQNLKSQEFDGETDFSAYFPRLFITIKP